MNESLLKKEFKEKDVNRARNLINKDYSASTTVQSGYTKAFIHRQEGDTWEEDGRQWTVKDGIRQNVTKLDAVKDAIRIPLTCPKCNGPMNHWLAKKMYRIHGFCFDPCTVEYEAELRKIGLFEQYQNRMIQGNMKAFAGDLEQWVLENIDFTETYVTEQGDLEDWNSNSQVQKEKSLTNVKEFLDKVKKFIETS
jgi:hypothetical protein